MSGSDLEFDEDISLETSEPALTWIKSNQIIAKASTGSEDDKEGDINPFLQENNNLRLRRSRVRMNTLSYSKNYLTCLQYIWSGYFLWTINARQKVH